MELDEFKTHWKDIHDSELKQQKYTTEKLDHIIMNTTNTLGELQKKNIYWSKRAKIIGAADYRPLSDRPYFILFSP